MCTGKEILAPHPHPLHSFHSAGEQSKVTALLLVNRDMHTGNFLLPHAPLFLIHPSLPPPRFLGSVHAPALVLNGLTWSFLSNGGLGSGILLAKSESVLPTPDPLQPQEQS